MLYLCTVPVLLSLYVREHVSSSALLLPRELSRDLINYFQIMRTVRPACTRLRGRP